VNKTAAASKLAGLATLDAPNPSLVRPLQSGTEEAAVKPLIYGYLRVTDELDDAEILQMECGLEKLAEAEGFRLIETRYEHQPGYYGTFYRLAAELKRVPVRHVVVPSLDHLSSHPLLRDQLITRLDEANVRLWVVEP